MLQALYALAALAAAVAPAAAETLCNATTLCPKAYPCCSEYGYCQKGAFCLGGCNPLSECSLKRCSTITALANTRRLVPPRKLHARARVREPHERFLDRPQPRAPQPHAV